ncbi:MAG: hypothetical protein ACLPY1_23700 [Terracidiphilus sp.]
MNASIGNDRLSLSALLSMALVAFTIELDNEFEHLTPHRTTDYASTPGAPWLVSMVMWSRFLRFVPEEGITFRELLLQSRLSAKEMRLWLTRLSQWWGYLVIEAAGSSKRFNPEARVRPTAGGRKAIAVWRPLAGVIEERWRARFGQDKIGALKQSLSSLAAQLDPGLPDSLPILGYGLFSSGPDDLKGAPVRGALAEPSLAGLLSKVLLAFAIEFEGESEVSLAIAANVLRLACNKGVRIKDLPRMAGVSKEAIAIAVSYLEKRGYAVLAPESDSSRVKVLMLIAKGRNAQKFCGELVWKIEERWRGRWGNDCLGKIREVLEQLVGEPEAKQSPLMSGLQPYPDCWRASIPPPEGLPHYPMILHRGGFPDGS